MWKSNFGQIFLDFWLVSTGFPRYMRQLMWFQRVSSVDVGGRCLYGAFAMHALAGCKLLSGCLKCCGTSSVKWRCLLASAVLALFSSWSAVLPWLFESLFFFLDFLECCSSLTFWDCYKLFVFDFRADLFRWLGFTSSDATTPLLGLQGEETASKWEMGLAPPRAL